MKLYNTLSRTTETFSPSGDIVTMYVCGLTPQGPPHVGHAMRAVVFDVIRRHLEFKGYAVKHVENFTDIDDKMIEAAAKLGITTQEVAKQNIDVYLKEMDALNVLRAHAYPKATEEIAMIRQIIEALIEKEYAYAVAGNVYFHVRRDGDYGKLSGRSLNDMRAGARVEVDEKKEDPMDFALWKSQKPGEPAWDSPWGPGRPGWHIECTAMSMSYLGTTVDIHGGGQDLVFPHHENEIAQSESYNDDVPMARFWVHNGLVRLGDDKMSKSQGIFVTVSEALEKHSPDALRLLFLGSHYRSPLTYTEESVVAQERAAERLRNAVNLPGAPADGPPLDPDSYKESFVAAMDDDFNTPRALAVLFDLSHEINRSQEKGGEVSDAQSVLRELSGGLGLTLKERQRIKVGDATWLAQALSSVHAELLDADQRELADGIKDKLVEYGVQLGEAGGLLQPLDKTTLKAPGELRDEDVPQFIELLVQTRTQLRDAKYYEFADKVRKSLADAGYVLEDTPRGTQWKRGPSHA